jgi:hypothetical protein
MARKWRYGKSDGKTGPPTGLNLEATRFTRYVIDAELRPASNASIIASRIGWNSRCSSSGGQAAGRASSSATSKARRVHPAGAIPRDLPILWVQIDAHSESRSRERASPREGRSTFDYWERRFMAGKPKQLTKEDQEFIAAVPGILRSAYPRRHAHNEIAADFDVSVETAKGWLYKGAFPIARKQQFVRVARRRIYFEIERAKKTRPFLVEWVHSALQERFRQRRLAGGEPFIVHPREAAKSTAAYQTDPEILLGCIIVSGARDTGEVLKTDVLVTRGLEVSDDDRAAFDAFRRVWQFPTGDERATVLKWAERIAKQSRRPYRRGFQWTRPS